MADVTTHTNTVRPDSMELLTKADRVPERLRRLENAAASGLLGGGSAAPVAFTLTGWAAPFALAAAAWTHVPIPSSGFLTEPTGAFTRNANGSLTVRDAGWYQMQTTGYITGGSGSTGISIHNAANAEGGLGQMFLSTSAVIVAVNAYYLTAGFTLYVNAYSSTAGATCQLRGFSVTRVGGPKGDTGPQGAQGIQGVKGDQGIQGPVGAQGVKGDTGLTGPPSATAQPGAPTPRNEIYVWVDTDEPMPAMVPAPGASGSLVSVLPSSPVDGQEVYFQNAAMVTDGLIWHLRYRSAAPGSYKWEFIGGSPLYVVRQQRESTGTSQAWADIVPPGPELTIPLAGDYMVEFGAESETNAASMILQMGIINASTGNPSGDNVIDMRSIVGKVTTSRAVRMNALVTGPLKARYWAMTAANCWWTQRWIKARPVRVA
jgi:hypothetical protein